MLKKLTAYPILLLLLSACETHFPVLMENQSCKEAIETVELTDIDYLLFANKMIDSMIQDKNIQRETANNRMKLSLLPIKNNTNETIEMSVINLAIKNRLVRSGQFIINESASEPLQLSGAFEKVEQSPSTCAQKYTRFALQLKNTRSNRILWSEDTKFN